MSEPKSTACPKCGAPLAPDAPEGLCPRCLVQMNLTAPTQLPGTAGVGAAGTAAPGPPLTPEQIAPNFPQLEILECLGRGGMGVVYKARQPRLNRFVALKILAPGRETDPQFADRFIREAQALARLNHPNIVGVYDFGESGGMYYLLMEYVDGANVRGLLAGGKLAPAQALAIVPRICEALQYAHEEGVVHRDIKPENVLVDKQGRVKIADFGIARILGAENGATVTRDRYVIGTPYYMAPEQVEHPMTVDHRADIYSLGVVFYEMLTGELPLGRFATPSQKVQIDVRLDEVVLRALEKEPELRYQHASQVKTALDTIASTSAPASSAAPASAAAAASGFVASPQPTASTAGAPPPLAPNPPPVMPAPPPASLPLAAGQLSVQPRFSRKAIIGAIWALLSLFAFIPLFWVAEVHEVGRGEAPIGVPWFGLLIMIPLFFLGLTAPFGTTILGWAAVSDIRRSAGRIHGLWLAVLDGLLFPLLALDGLILILWMIFAKGFIHWSANENAPARVAFLVGLTCLVVDFLIIWKVWHAVKTPLNGGAVVATPGPQSGGAGRILVMVTLILLLILAIPAGLLLLFVGFAQASVHQRMGGAYTVAAANQPTPNNSPNLVRYWVFAVDANAVEKVATSGQMNMDPKLGWSQQVSYADFQPLLNSAPQGTTVLTSGQLDIEPAFWPHGEAEGWSYANADGDTGGASGFLGVRPIPPYNGTGGGPVQEDGRELNIDYNVSDIYAQAQEAISDWKILYNGKAPVGGFLAFFKPFTTKDGRYLVVAFDMPHAQSRSDEAVANAAVAQFDPTLNQTASAQNASTASSTIPPAQPVVEVVVPSAPTDDHFANGFRPAIPTIPSVPTMPTMPTMPTIPPIPPMPTMPVAARAQNISSFVVPPAAVAPGKTWDATDFKRRFNAAQSISNFMQRDSALAELALDAARAGQAMETKNVVGSISNFATRDSTAAQAALLLLAAGQRQPAIDVANLISNFQTRDATLAKLTK